MYPDKKRNCQTGFRGELEDEENIHVVSIGA
jgi:hypothetical protein